MRIVYSIIIGILFSSAAAAQGYESMTSVINFNHVQNYEVTLLEGTSVTLSYHGSSSEDAAHTIRTIARASEIFSDYAAENNIEGSQCKSYDRINVYELRRDDLNDRSLMSFVRWSYWNNENIAGLYDSMVSPPGEAGLFLSRSISTRSYKEMIIAHETSHMIQDIFCIARNDPGLQESMAMKFEMYFSRR
jgi:hypothetical protein